MPGGLLNRTLGPKMKTPARKPLRLWPGVVIAILLCLVRFVVPVVVPDATLVGVLAVPIGVLAIVLWWVFFSRAPWSERLGAVGLMVAALFATSRIIDKSIATGAQGMLFPILAIPVVSLALVVWAVATRRLSAGPRRATMVATILLASGMWALVRTGGFTASSFRNDLHWRWTKTPEERLLAKSGNEPGALLAVRPAAETPEKQLVAKAGKDPEELPPVRAAAKTPEKRLVTKAGDAPEPLPSGAPDTGAEWPGLRGLHRDGVAAGRAVAPADRTGLVVLRGPRRPPLHPRAARSRRGRRLLQADHRRAGVGTPRPDPVLGVEWRPRSARDADPQPWPHVHIWRHRSSERAQRR